MCESDDIFLMLGTRTFPVLSLGGCEGPLINALFVFCSSDYFDPIVSFTVYMLFIDFSNLRLSCRHLSAGLILRLLLRFSWADVLGKFTSGGPPMKFLDRVFGDIKSAINVDRWNHTLFSPSPASGAGHAHILQKLIQRD